MDSTATFPTDTEHEVIVAAMLYSECATVFKQSIRPEHFADPRYAALAAEILDQLRSGDEINPAVMARNLKSNPAFPGGNDDVVAFIQTLEYASSALFAKNCSDLIEASSKREMLTDFHQLQYMARNGETSAEVRRATIEAVNKWRQATDGISGNRPISFGELEKQYPTLRPPVIQGIARQQDTINFISTSKAGKTCAMHGLALSFVSRRPWLDLFDTVGGRVLLLDNELQKDLIVERIRRIAEAMGIHPDEYRKNLDVWPMRGKRRDINSVATELMGLARGEYQLVIWDSKYRFMPANVSENDNAHETQTYNLMDELGDRIDCVNLLVHHSSKGGQSDKRGTDVGAGAGAQSRAADAHVILREHEEENVFVLEGAIRSFPPIAPVAVRWEYPTWTVDHVADPARLKRAPTGNQVRQEAADREGMELIIKALRGCPSTARALRPKTGLGKDRQQRLLDRMVAEGHATTQTTTIRGNETDEYHLAN